MNGFIFKGYSLKPNLDLMEYQDLLLLLSPPLPMPMPMPMPVMAFGNDWVPGSDQQNQVEYKSN